MSIAMLHQHNLLGCGERYTMVLLIQGFNLFAFWKGSRTLIFFANENTSGLLVGTPNYEPQMRRALAHSLEAKWRLWLNPFHPDNFTSRAQHLLKRDAHNDIDAYDSYDFKGLWFLTGEPSPSDLHDIISDFIIMQGLHPKAPESLFTSATYR